MMGTFEIKREDDGSFMAGYYAKPEGKFVFEVLQDLQKSGHDGILLDDATMRLTDSDLFFPGQVYKFRPSILVPSLGL
jgi:hypothetical protein